jgi:YfiR/HmsC-like
MLKRFVILIMLLSRVYGICQGQSQSEANLKAVFIYNFTRYIEWENLDNDRRFIIGILGQSTVDKPLREIARSGFVNNKRIELKYFSSPEDISYCHILFIPRNSSYDLPTILDKVDKGVLTISEAPGSAKMGTAINFVVLNEKLKFEMNKRSIYLAGLKASSQLLKLALIVD